MNYTPTVDQVAANILSRTRNTMGVMLNTFDATTVPTDTQVQAIIDQVLPEVQDVIGEDVPTALIDDAEQAVALRAAMGIELGFFSDQVNTGRSIYPQLKEMYEAALKRVSTAVVQIDESSGTVVINAAAAREPSYTFPDAVDWMTRRL